MPKVRIQNGAKPTVFPWGVVPAGKTAVLDVSARGVEVVEFALKKGKIKSYEVLPAEGPTPVSVDTEVPAGDISEESAVDPALEEARATFEALTGKKAGRRKLETLLKEISDASG